MVELGQAELARTSAEIAVSSANYDLLAQQSLLSFESGALSHSTTIPKL